MPWDKRRINPDWLTTQPFIVVWKQIVEKCVNAGESLRPVANFNESDKGKKVKIDGQIEFTITERSLDQVTAEMPIQAGILNPFGTVHAGATLSLPKLR
jgi:hypothetical protein